MYLNLISKEASVSLKHLMKSLLVILFEHRATTGMEAHLGFRLRKKCALRMSCIILPSQLLGIIGCAHTVSRCRNAVKNLPALPCRT